MNKPIFHSLIILALFFISCGDKYTPKPRGFFRIDMPEKEYKHYQNVCPYSFDIPVYAEAIPDSGYNTEPCWINIKFPTFKAEINISYKEIVHDSLLNKYLNDSYTLVQKHNIKAEAIKENYFEDKEKRVFSMMYEIKGNAASPIQFFLTDSTDNFFRGALYFNTAPNKDSLTPVINFIQEDIIRLIETFQWKN